MRGEREDEKVTSNTGALCATACRESFFFFLKIVKMGNCNLSTESLLVISLYLASALHFARESMRKLDLK